MKFKNEDGTINAIPIAAVFTIFSIALYILLFGIQIKQDIEEDLEDTTPISTKAPVETTTISLCNNCSMSFNVRSADVAINGLLDIKELLRLYRVNIANVKFTSGNEELFTVIAHGSSYAIKTGNVTGTAKLTAEFMDQKTDITINVVGMDNADIKFKYDYYIVRVDDSISPELTVYPYSLNLDIVKYCTGYNENYISCSEEENEVYGQQVGSSKYEIKYRNIKASTMIYVVKTLLTIKVNEDGTYKSTREVTPTGKSFDFTIYIDDKEKEGFDNKDISISFDSNPLDVTVKYAGPDKTKNSYVYHAELNENASGTSVMRATLSDGSFMLLNINK